MLQNKTGYNCYKIIFSAIGGDIFEYCVGERKTFTEDESKNLTRQLAQALEFIHSKYIVHLDVKTTKYITF